MRATASSSPSNYSNYVADRLADNASIADDMSCQQSEDVACRGNVHSTRGARVRRHDNGSVSRASRLNRITGSLTHAQVAGVTAAAKHASLIGLPLNRHVTLRLERAGVADIGSVSAIGRFLTCLRDWLRKRGHFSAHVWVRERGPVIGSHVHILLHLPSGVSLRGGRTRRWIEAVTGSKYVAGTVCTRRIGSVAYEANLGNLVAYLCKGASPNVAEELNLPRRKRGGSIVGKRAGWSQNVGATARARWRLSTSA